MQCGDSDVRRPCSQQPFLAFAVSNVTFENSWSKFHLALDPHIPPLHCAQIEDKGSSGRSMEQDLTWPSDYSCFASSHPECRFYCCFCFCFCFKKTQLLMTYRSVHFDTFSPRVETEGLTLPGVFLPNKTLHIHEEILLMAWLTPKIHRDCHSPTFHSMRSSKI